jgi:DNA methylase/NACHT-associated inactive restriction endonuclease
MPGVPLQNDWDDINPAMGDESLGYPTQKPLALLERIVGASSNEGDVVLDPFCGCGTAIHAAEKLKREWVGIDITNLAISLVEKRLRDAFPAIKFEVHGTPKDLEGARNLAARDKYQFQWWACSLVNAQPYQGKKKGADSGIDGLIYFQDDNGPPKKVIVSVKGGENVSVAMVRDLAHVVDREKAQIGLFVTLAASTKPMRDEASTAGFYDSPVNASFPKIQILTIECLMNGTEQARYPDLARGGHTFKKAKREEKNQEQNKLF